MADPADLASTLGTWVAVMLALVALVSILTTVRLMQGKRAERIRALNEIDSVGTGYILELWKFTEEIRIRSVRIPILNQQPGNASPKGKVLKFKEKIGGMSRFDTSSTGWVNLAKFAELYSSDLIYGDSLLIRNDETWLPIHRFVMLAIGLRGRYGHRFDEGQSRRLKTTARLFTEGPGRTDNIAYESHTHSSTQRLSGSTGIMWWRQQLDLRESRFDEVYFAAHEDPDNWDPSADPTPLSELFWLSIGCLPIADQGDDGKYNGEEAVLDLNYKEPNMAIVTRPPRGFPETEEQNTITTQNTTEAQNVTGTQSITEAQNVTAIQNTTEEQNATRAQNITVARDTAEDCFKKRDSIRFAHRKWVQAMGITCNRVYYIQIPDDSEDKPEILPKNLQRIALGIMRLHLSSRGFFSLRKGALSSLLQPLGNYEGFILRAIAENVDVASTGLIKDLRDHISRGKLNGFSRGRAALCYQLDTALDIAVNPIFEGAAAARPTTGDAAVPGGATSNLRLPSMAEYLQNIIWILAIREAKFSKQMVSVMDNTYSNYDIVLNVQGENVRVDATDYPLDFSQLPDAPTVTDITLDVQHHRFAIIFCFLRACIRMLAVDNSLDSVPLLDCIDRMTPIVHVSQSTYAPPLFTEPVRKQDTVREPDIVKKLDTESSNEYTPSTLGDRDSSIAGSLDNLVHDD